LVKWSWRWPGIYSGAEEEGVVVVDRDAAWVRGGIREERRVTCGVAAWTGRCGRGGFIATRVMFFGTVVPEKIFRLGLVHAPYE
jgi:hypothetical protein